jgi:cytochrome P450
MRFAMEEMKIVLMRIFQHFDLEMTKPALGEALPMSSAFLLAPKGGIHMKLRLRHPLDAVPHVLDNEP